MYETISKRVFRDPLYGYISVDDKLIWELINSKEVQRLKRIKQLGGVNSVFHTAEHSRFAHSLGVYHLATKAVSETPDIKSFLDERNKLLLYSAALLHDIGHGPFSHSFEDSFDLKHEELGCRIILGNSEVNNILNTIDNSFATDVAAVICKQHKNKVIQELISSQLDLDRLDYLSRDSYMTGAKYGEVDVDRILRTLLIVDGNLVHKSTSIIAIEDYLMSRYNMYWQVYFHPVARSFELIILNIYRRLKELLAEGVQFNAIFTPLLPFLKQDKITIEDLLRLDDNVIYNIILESENHPDKILSDLAKRIINRQLFKEIVVNDENKDKIKSIKDNVYTKGYSPDYYFIEDSVKQFIYKTGYDLDKAANIKLLTPNKKVVELKRESKIINALVDIASKSEERIFFPADCLT